MAKNGINKSGQRSKKEGKRTIMSEAEYYELAKIDNNNHNRLFRVTLFKKRDDNEISKVLWYNKERDVHKGLKDFKIQNVDWTEACGEVEERPNVEKKRLQPSKAEVEYAAQFADGPPATKNEKLDMQVFSKVNQFRIQLVNFKKEILRLEEWSENFMLEGIKQKGEESCSMETE